MFYCISSITAPSSTFSPLHEGNVIKRQAYAHWWELLVEAQIICYKIASTLHLRVYSSDDFTLYTTNSLQVQAGGMFINSVKVGSSLVCFTE
jgi:hypothetical protein